MQIINPLSVQTAIICMRENRDKIMLLQLCEVSFTRLLYKEMTGDNYYYCQSLLGETPDKSFSFIFEYFSEVVCHFRLPKPERK